LEGDWTVPDGATKLQQIFLYRFNQEGRVWYGPVTVTDGSAAGPEDCGRRVSGTFPTIERNSFSIIRYEDDDLATVQPRARVQLQYSKD
ncbi:MAG: hypothetical protein ACOCX2_14085, partial [Armatimonadota bacterium]